MIFGYTEQQIAHFFLTYGVGAFILFMVFIILQLARDRGLTVDERKVSIDEWKDGVASGEISEAFACGTAAVITPIGQLKGKAFAVGDIAAPAGEVTMAIRRELTDIQYGRLPDRHGWLVKLR